MDRDRRRDSGLLDRAARSVATAAGTSAIPSCSIARGKYKRRGESWRSSSATIRCPTRLGFTTSAVPGPVAAADFMGKVAAIGDACRHNPATLVSVILDGENCWEYYPDGGVSFLRSLYQAVARDPRVRPVKIGEFLRDHPPADSLHHLFAGSWISHNFAIWIGHPEDNRGWDALHAARDVPRRRGTLRQARSGRAGQSLGRALHRPGL